MLSGIAPYSNHHAGILARNLVFFIVCGTLVSSCGRNYEEETTQLERAEAYFTAGEYDSAEQMYRKYLQRHGRSPYSSIARQRLRILDRELEAVMGQHGTLTPLHVKQRLPVHMDASNSKFKDADE